MTRFQPLQRFVLSFSELLNEEYARELDLLNDGTELLKALLAEKDWLPEKYRQTSSEKYQQYLLYLDPEQRFSVVSFCWAPGQTTPVHDHTVWGLIGVLEGAELCEEYEYAGHQLKKTGQHVMHQGQVDIVSPSIGDIHRVSNAFDDQASISVHVYGGNIGMIDRHLYDEKTNRMSSFVSGYDNTAGPDIWSLEQTG